LRVELATHRADARLARLALLELGVELLLKVDDIEAGGRAGGEGGRGVRGMRVSGGWRDW
jgi:hypothetical protein